MGFWVALAMLVISTVVSAMLAPKPKDAEPSSLGEFQAPTAEEGRPIAMVLGTCKIKGPNITWWGALRTEAVKRVSNAMTGSRTTIGYKYHLGMQHVLAVGPVDALVDIVVGDKSLGFVSELPYSALGTDLSINLPDLFGGDEKEGGLSGVLRFYFGSDTQVADPYLEGQFGTPAPAWRGICYAVLKDFYLGTSNYPKEWAWVLRCCPCATGLDPSKRNIDGDANPAYGLVYILTQPRELGGCGEALGTLDLATFQSVGSALFAEGFGISLLMDRAQSADAWMGEVLRHIDGVLYTDPASGLTCLKLIRADYDPATLPEFTEADILEAPEVTLAAPPDTLNRIVVRYVDRAQAYTVRTAQAQDAGNYWARGEGADTTMDFMGLSKAALAQYVAAREMRAAASPLAKGTLQLNRKAWNLRPGSPFKLSFAPQNWSSLLCRVTNIRYGTLGAGKITVEFAQDVFSVGAQAYTPPGGGGWTDPVTAPQPCSAQALLEAPFWLSGAARQVLAMGARADAATLGADIWTNEGAGYLLTGSLPSMAPTGLLSAAYSCKTAALDTVGFTVSGGSDLAQLPALSTNVDGCTRGVNLAWFPATGEIISWTTATDLGGGSFSITGNLRGITDTVPSDLASGDRVWFLSAGASDTQTSAGGSGATGSMGDPGATGRGYTWHGAWDVAHTYAVDDTVSRNGSSYVSIQAGSGHDPATATAYWDILAQKGSDGSGVPTGGTTSQALVKASNADGDVEWSNVSGGGGGVKALAPCPGARVYAGNFLPMVNGKMALIGGTDGSTVRPEIYFYDPATDLWSAGPSMASGVQLHGLSKLPDGGVLIVGGENGGYTTACKILSADGTTVSTTGSLGTPRGFGDCVLLETGSNAGKVMTFAGWNGGRVYNTEIYDPTAGTWSAGPTSCPAGFFHHAYGIFGNGKVALVGGWDSPVGVYVYDPVANTWTPGESCPRSVRNGRLVRTAGGNLLLIAANLEHLYTHPIFELDQNSFKWVAAHGLDFNRGWSVAISDLYDGAYILVGGSFATDIDAHPFATQITL